MSSLYIFTVLYSNLLLPFPLPQPPSEEGSGAVTDSSSSHTSLSLKSASGLLDSARLVPTVMSRLSEKPNMDDSLLNFGQERRGSLEESAAGANQIEASIGARTLIIACMP